MLFDCPSRDWSRCHIVDLGPLNDEELEVDDIYFEDITFSDSCCIGIVGLQSLWPNNTSTIRIVTFERPIVPGREYIANFEISGVRLWFMISELEPRVFDCTYYKQSKVL